MPSSAVSLPEMRIPRRDGWTGLVDDADDEDYETHPGEFQHTPQGIP